MLNNILSFFLMLFLLGCQNTVSNEEIRNSEWEVIGGRDDLIFGENLKFKAYSSEAGGRYMGDYIIHNDTIITKARYWANGEMLPPLLRDHLQKFIIKNEELWLVSAQVKGNPPIIFDNPQRYVLIYKYYDSKK